MADAPAWLPRLLELSDSGGDWNCYLEAAYGEFRRDFIASEPQHDGRPVVCRRDPIQDGKEAGFWHCTSEGPDEQNRTPDIRRLERVRWIKAVLENSRDPLVDVWSSERRGDRRRVLWYAEEFAVVIAARPWGATSPKYWQLITAYCTLEEHRKRKFRRDRDRFRNS